MFTLRILITFSEQIDWMKADLTKYLPHVKSSHRVEALARALGFKTYAALRSVDLFYEGGIIAEVNWEAFNVYLTEHGFKVKAKPLYLTVGRASVRFLTEWADHDQRRLARKVYAERSKQKLDDLLSDGSIEEYLRAYSLVSKIEGTRTITKRRNAYDLKCLAEKVSFIYPDGEISPPSKVALGSLVLATQEAGFWFRPMDGELQSLHFNMLQSSIDELTKNMA